MRPNLTPYLELTKPEIALVVALSSAGGFVLAPAEFFGWGRLGLLLLGVTLVSGTGLATAGTAVLALAVNPLTGGLTLLTVLLYVFAYTPLKRRTHWNTLVGTVPGALPALCGWTAATGSVGWGGIAMFSILVPWQMAHFLPLAWMYREDYGQGGFVMLPAVDPAGRSTVRQTLFFAVLLAALSLWPVGLSLAGWIYFVGAAALAVWFMTAAAEFRRSRGTPGARRVLKAAIAYVPALIAVLVLDRVVLG